MKTNSVKRNPDAGSKNARQAAAPPEKAPELKKQQKPAYSVRSNLVYIVKNAWTRDKSVLFTIFVQIVLTVAASTVALYLPRTVIAQVSGGVPVPTLVGSVLAFTAGLVLINAVKNYVDAVAKPPRISMRMGANRDVLFKDMATDYENFGHQRFLDDLGKARGVLRGNHAATEAVYPCLSRLGADVLGFVVYIALLTAVNPFVLLLTALTTVSSVWVRRRAERWQRAHDDEEGGYWSRLWYMCGIAENYKLAKDIRLFAMDDWLRDVYRSNRRLLFHFSRRVQLRHLLADATDCLAAFLREGVSYAYLIGLVLAGTLSAADFVLLFSAIGGFSGWILGIMQDYAQLAQYSIGISQLREFLEYPDAFRREGGSPVPQPKNGAYTLELQNVTYRYAGAEENALEHVNLTIRPGEKLAVVGLNGAGKTTLVLLLCGLLEPTEGIVLLDGHDIRTFSRERYYELFTAVFQEFSILPMTIAENVAQCPAERIDRARLDRCLSLADAADTIGRLSRGADTPLNKKIHGDAVELSGGEMQRLMLARALYKDAPMLILDEPTAALDPIAESRLYAHYNELSRGRTSVYISHRLASTRFCDRIILLGHKTIEECGTHDELMAADGEYARLFAIQSKYYQENGGEATA